ncbi:ergothioneine biosynthesis protein EgtB [Caenimonas aquaedulcis]|uniref:Ergothioneine biosynthesis protein EgtB n=1 Tax=Caenimonas aquaedulcis TaxID=2793270 RepID=A0A931MIN3_9BURK|nr:ergothioneine biosynthesis protein EgtB [Caenimonas aquaedulcis]MBG9390331.1 ergothioneine biosynthesis protein EgtB [Caenimonas aquaedulcis]
MPVTALSASPDCRADEWRDSLKNRLAEVRAHTLALAAPLSAEDQCVQSMPDCSPTKWHLAHTSWFFEAVILAAHQPGYVPFNPRYFHLFNSYYESLGPRHPRPQRGLLTRPSHDEILAYRRHVDAAMSRFIGESRGAAWQAAAPLVELGLNHEQQHQELILTDILHALSCNPLLPAYQPAPARALHLATPLPALQWLDAPGGTVEVGHGSDAFAFDNETPRHRVLLAPYRIANRLVTCGDFAEFIADGGYETASLWLSDGWAAVQAGGWKAPAYWIAPGDVRAPVSHWQVFGLHGAQALDAAAPVTQLSFYEAAAYAEWAGARLPTEFEWEAAWELPGITQMTGHAWQWTRSSYDPYPGFRPFAGAVGEYNGKFMVGQQVLRGGSLATPAGHARPTYRNFFPPGARWQFSGLRLAKEAGAC